jgi:hypothetical protein
LVLPLIGRTLHSALHLQMEGSADERRVAGSLASAGSDPEEGTAMRIRIITFGLTIPAETYAAHAVDIAPAFTQWPGLLGKWWLGETASGTYGGVYLFASRRDADLSRETDLFGSMYANPALKDIVVHEYDVLEAPSGITAASYASAPSRSTS